MKKRIPGKGHNAYLTRLRAEERPVKNIRYALTLLARFGAPAESGLTVAEAQEFVTWCSSAVSLAPQSVNAVLTTLSAYYAYEKERNGTVANPFELVDRPQVGKILPKNIPNESDLMKLLTHLEQFLRDEESLRLSKGRYRTHVVCEFLYGTGVRISEASAVCIGDLDLSGRTVRIRDVKTNKERLCVMSEYTAALLQHWGELRSRVLKHPECELLFGSAQNLKVTVNAALKEACARLGQEPVTCHTFRHCFAYHLLKAGCDIRKIQSLLGHARLSSTQVYAKVDTESLKAVLDRYHPRTGKARKV